jgi:Uma2 family endonuclease
MRAVMSTVPPDVLALRKRTGADRWDEMWEGVLHMPPAPNLRHQDLEYLVECYLRRWCAPATGARVYHNVNVAAVGGWPDDYRVPDLVLLSPESRATAQGEYVEGPPDVVIEIRSPGDETLEKLAFYARLGVPEVWVLDRDSKVPTLYALSAEAYETKAPDEHGWLRSEAAGIELRSAGRGRLWLRVAGDGSSREEIGG